MEFNIYDFSSFTRSIHQLLAGSLSPLWVFIIELVLVGIVFLAFYAVLGLFLVYLERRVCAFIQNRLGPNRVGPQGIFQTIADLIKLLFKELFVVRKADKILFNLAPFIVIIASLLAIGAIPYAKGLHAIDLNIGVFFILAITSLGVIGILLAGWSSNSKYSLLGAMRS